MTRVKIIAVSDASKAGKNDGAATPPYCTNPAYIGRLGNSMGGIMTLSTIPTIVSVHVRIDDDGDWLFKPEQLEEIAE